jgi:hypothetical protein
MHSLTTNKDDSQMKDKLEEINQNIDAHPHKEGDFQRTFCRAIANHVVRSQVLFLYMNEETTNHEHFARTGELRRIKMSWILQRAINATRTALPLPTPDGRPYRPRVSAITTATAPLPYPPPIPVEFQTGKITEKGREFFEANFGCVFCRKLGHKLSTCAEKAAYRGAQLESGKIVRTNLDPANPSGLKPG